GDGIYHVRVQSAVQNVTGYYNLTVADATVRTAPLTINETVTGQLASPYSIDRWALSAVAGETVRFKLVAAASSDIQFDLTGPNGYTAFSGLTTSSTPLILPADGTYTLTVRTVGLPGGYAFQLQQSSVTPLTVNSPYQGILTASDQAQLFS